jgi:hypothetical protein
VLRATNTAGNELSVSTARNGLDRDAGCLTGLGQPLAAVAEAPRGWPPKAAIGEFTQNRDDGFGVMAVCRCDIDRQRNIAGGIL